MEPPTPIVQVETVLQCARALGVLRSPAHDVQVRAPIAIRIEEDGTHVLRNLVCFEEARIAAHERAVPLLQQQLTRLLLRPADEDIIEPVAIHVGHGHARALRRDHLRDETLTVEIDERIFLMAEAERRSCRDVGQQGRDAWRHSGRHGRGRGFRLPHGDELVRRHVPAHTDPPVRPDHPQRIH